MTIENVVLGISACLNSHGEHGVVKEMEKRMTDAHLGSDELFCFCCYLVCWAALACAACVIFFFCIFLR